MKRIRINPQGVVCPQLISCCLSDDERIHNLSFIGGCNGNLKALSKVLEGMKAEEAIRLFKGITCGKKNTSCMNELVRALENESQMA